MPYDRAISTALVNTKKGRVLFNMLLKRNGKDVQIEKLDLNKEATVNKALAKPAIRPNQRDSIYEDLSSLEYHYFNDKYLSKKTIKMRIKGTIRALIPNRARHQIKAIFKREQ